MSNYEAKVKNQQLSVVFKVPQNINTNGRKSETSKYIGNQIDPVALAYSAGYQYNKNLSYEQGTKQAIYSQEIDKRPVISQQGLVGGGVILYAQEGIEQSSTQTTVHTTATKTSSISKNATATTAYNKVSNAVVSVLNFSKSGQNYEESSEGSGVIYKKADQSAFIVTNNHVIDGAAKIQVMLHNGKKVTATLVGKDAMTDLAVLKIESDNVTTTAEFGDSSKNSGWRKCVSDWFSSRIRVCLFGHARQIKRAIFKDGIAEYTKRLSRFAKVHLIEVPDERTPEKASEAENTQIMAKEGQRIQEKIGARDYVIVLAIEGKQLPSEVFAEKMNQITVDGYSDVTFIIGGSLGLSPEVKHRANFKISFGLLTLPHQLMRLVLD
ncbi:hypothetical protein Pfo_030897 [Paulownia fortunei]|nr:hypothetical protein Pfo_030897 [Paulownia fortunei]